MSGDYIMAVKSIGLSKVGGRKPCTLDGAAKHNKRELAPELEARGRIDGARTRLNYSLAGAADVDGIVALVLKLMADIGTSPDERRRDYCQAVEIVFSLPPTTTIDTTRYFADCVDWCSDRFGADNILSADVHHDEPSNPHHAHVLIAPIQGGRWAGGNPIGIDGNLAARKPATASPIGIENGGEKRQSLSCVGIDSTSPAIRTRFKTVAARQPAGDLTEAGDHDHQHCDGDTFPDDEDLLQTSVPLPENSPSRSHARGGAQGIDDRPVVVAGDDGTTRTRDHQPDVQPDYPDSGQAPGDW